MDSDEIYKFIGYAVAVIFFIYLISKAFSLNVRVIEGMTFINDDKTDIKNNKDSGKETGDKKQISKKMEDDNNIIKNSLINKKNEYKDILSAAYNHQLYSLIELSAQIGTKQTNSKLDGTLDQTSVDAFKNLKVMKDYLDILEFSYDQVSDLSNS